MFSLFCSQDMNLPVFLDTEIWKASCYINQKTPQQTERTGDQIVEHWEHFGIAWRKDLSEHLNVQNVYQNL